MELNLKFTDEFPESAAAFLQCCVFTWGRFIPRFEVKADRGAAARYFGATTLINVLLCNCCCFAHAETCLTHAMTDDRHIVNKNYSCTRKNVMLPHCNNTSTLWKQRCKTSQVNTTCGTTWLDNTNTPRMERKPASLVSDDVIQSFILTFTSPHLWPASLNTAGEHRTDRTDHLRHLKLIIHDRISTQTTVATEQSCSLKTFQ